MTDLLETANKLSQNAQSLVVATEDLTRQAKILQFTNAAKETGDAFVLAFTVFVLACFVGYYVVWKVTPALHTPLMSVTNAISSIIIVGAIIASATTISLFSSSLGIIAIFIASINIFGGFIVTQRMLQMFKKKS